MTGSKRYAGRIYKTSLSFPRANHPAVDLHRRVLEFYAVIFLYHKEPFTLKAPPTWKQIEKRILACLSCYLIVRGEVRLTKPPWESRV